MLTASSLIRHVLSIGIATGLLVLSGCGWSDFKESLYKSEVPVSDPRSEEKTAEPKPSTLKEPNNDAESTEGVPSLNLGVPFYAQAPFGNWDMPYQEACEEASLLLAHYYTTGQNRSIYEFEQDLLAMVDWEIETFGQYEHTSIEETARIAREYLGHEAVEILDNPTLDTLKATLAAGTPIIAPFAGRYLGNPYFTGEGPVYHMLVIRGYDETHFITNDVGTRHGENFIYSYNVLMEALHDWDEAANTDPDGILEGEKRVLILGQVGKTE